MTYLYWYLGLGAISLAVTIIRAHLRYISASGQANNFIFHANPLLDKLLLALFFVLLLPLWPIILIRSAKQSDPAPPFEEIDPPDDFAVKRDHLLKQWSLAEIETKEMISDPLKAAPELPFGHLNQAWESFKQSMQEGDQLWSFSTPRTRKLAGDEVHNGYVIVHGELIGPYFLTRSMNT
jgi:hypothetical protein